MFELARSRGHLPLERSRQAWSATYGARLLILAAIVIINLAALPLIYAVVWFVWKVGAFGVVVVLVALAVMILGYIGVFFGRLIQAAVSRHRERLADASAVQFTREPQGLKGALVKIGAQGGGSLLSDARTEEVAHMLFASGMRRMFATHPPLEERIRALDPHFDPAEFARVRLDPEIPAVAAPKTRERSCGCICVAMAANVKMRSTLS